MNTKWLLIGGAVFLVLLVGATFLIGDNTSGPSKLDGFAQCLKAKKAIFYGAFWCPHCQNQKRMFGSSVQYLPYVECSTADGKSQTQICIDQHIESYPTWEFADKSRLTGEIALETLAKKTSCQLPK